MAAGYVTGSRALRRAHVSEAARLGNPAPIHHPTGATMQSGTDPDEQLEATGDELEERLDHLDGQIDDAQGEAKARAQDTAADLGDDDDEGGHHGDDSGGEDPSGFDDPEAEEDDE
jgi:hypothetical protein